MTKYKNNLHKKLMAALFLAASKTESDIKSKSIWRLADTGDVVACAVA